MLWKALETWRMSLAYVAIVSIGGAGLADWLFYERTGGGVSYAIIAIALWTAILIRYPRLFKTRMGMLAVAWSGVLAALPADEPELLRMVMLVTVLVSLAMIGRCGWRPELRIWMLRWCDLLVLGWLRPFRDMRIVQRCRRHGPESKWLRVILVWCMPALIAAGFVLLFSVANPLIGRAVSLLGTWMQRVLSAIDIPSPLRVILWLVAGIGIWQLLRIRRRRERSAGALPPPIPRLGKDRETHFVIRTLLLCNVVFLAQNVMDSGFLWCGMKLPAGFTYASYAHRGAYPLIATALLAAAFILVAFRPQGAGMKSPWARSLVYAWLAQNVFLTLSAIWRLKIYVGAYSLTRLRVAAGIWMVIVMLGLLLIVWRIVHRYSNEWLVRANVMSLMVILSVCCLFNFDSTIAQWNVDVELSREHAIPIDLAYLRVLGPDALPAMWRLQDSREFQQKKALGEIIEHVEGQLADVPADWRRWTWRRSRLREWGIRSIQQDDDHVSQSDQ